MPESEPPTTPLQVPDRATPVPPRLLTDDELNAVVAAVAGVAWKIARRLCRERRRQRPDVGVVQNAVLFFGFWRCGRGFDDSYGDQNKPREQRFVSYVWDAGFRAGLECIDREYGGAETPTDASDAGEWIEGRAAAVVPEGWDQALSVCNRRERAVMLGLRDGRTVPELAAATGFPASQVQADYDSAVAKIRGARGIDPAA